MGGEEVTFFGVDGEVVTFLRVGGEDDGEGVVAPEVEEEDLGGSLL